MGDGRHAPPDASTSSACADRRERHAASAAAMHPQGRHQRSHARLDGHHRHHALHHRHVVGPHPFPLIVRDFQSVIGRETRAAVPDSSSRLPDCIVACVGGGSNAAGIFYPFIDDKDVKLVGVEAGGRGTTPASTPRRFLRQARRAARLAQLRPAGRRRPDRAVHSVSAGLDYPGVGPEHAYWTDTGRVDTMPCHAMPMRSTPSRLGPARRHHPRPGIRPRRRPRLKVAKPMRKIAPSSTSPAAATKTSTKPPACSACRMTRGRASAEI